MKKSLCTLGLLISGYAVPALAATSSAPPVQRVDVINMLWNSAGSATNPGLTGTSVTLKFYTSGSSTACYTVTLPFEGSTTFFSGTGLACTTAVKTMDITPIAAAATGTTPVYTATTGYALLGQTSPANDYSSQLFIAQGTTAPVFSSSNGALTTPGNVAVTEQDHD